MSAPEKRSGARGRNAPGHRIAVSPMAHVAEDVRAAIRPWTSNANGIGRELGRILGSFYRNGER